jgi:SAM-dependent methyltransferase
MNYCIVCGSEMIKKIHDNYAGYVEGEYYEIFSCLTCESHFIDPFKVDKSLYDIIYSNKNSLGYDRYLKYAEEISLQKDPLQYLSNKESTYYPVYKYLTGKKNLKILEIGCSYGYLTFAMNKAGHNAVGIDISHEAIEFALSHFGNSYQRSDIEDFIKITKEKFDLIVATEVVEHFSNPLLFFDQVKKLLNKNGSILLTTPNKDFTNKKFIWLTDLPPIHVTWLGKKSFIKIAEQKNFNVNFTSFFDYFPSNENRFIKYLRFQKDIIPIHFFSKNGKLIESNNERQLSKVRNIIKWIVHRFTPIRIISNIIFNIFNQEDNTLGVLLSTKYIRI